MNEETILLNDTFKHEDVNQLQSSKLLFAASSFGFLVFFGRQNRDSSKMNRRAHVKKNCLSIIQFSLYFIMNLYHVEFTAIVMFNFFVHYFHICSLAMNSVSRLCIYHHLKRSFWIQDGSQKAKEYFSVHKSIRHKGILYCEKKGYYAH